MSHQVRLISAELRPELCRYQLNDVDLTDFNPSSPPDLTDAFYEMVEESKPIWEVKLQDLYVGESEYFKDGFVSALEIYEYLATTCRFRVRLSDVKTSLELLGFTKIDTRYRYRTHRKTKSLSGIWYTDQDPDVVATKRGEILYEILASRKDETEWGFEDEDYDETQPQITAH